MEKIHIQWIIIIPKKITQKIYNLNEKESNNDNNNNDEENIKINLYIIIISSKKTIVFQEYFIYSIII